MNEVNSEGQEAVQEFIKRGKRLDSQNEGSSDQFYQAINCLNTDRAFITNKYRIDKQLKKVNITLRHNTKDLFFNRKFNLHSLYH